MTNITQTGSLIGDSFHRFHAIQAAGHLFLAAQGTDGKILTINGRIYECDASGDGVTAGSVQVDTSPGGISTIALEVPVWVDAINDDTSALAIYTAVGVSDTFGGTIDTVALYAQTPGTDGNDITLTTDITSATVSGATFANGQDIGESETYVIRHTVTTQEATSAFFFIHTPLAFIAEWSAAWEDGGLKKDLTSLVDIVVTLSGGDLIVHEGTAWTAGDVVIISATGYALARSQT